MGNHLLNFRVQREANNIKDQTQIDASIWSMYGSYNTWTHYVMTYKYISLNAENNVLVYVNGYYFSAWGQDPPVSYTLDEDYSGCGRLDLGRYSLDLYDVGQGNMVLDELILWEEQITAQHAQDLYRAYQPDAG